ncbi:PAS domain S-box protein [Oculatella sp. FACHB-28]|uniref:PAS domain-containing sensor histidine kinase n=1 Tax=Oculatella sp. FACHB-28 TaxID=2692845 RepID=UPI0018F04CB4|nr:PAS domain S-box protein [Oculatella sp. FACHB-28]
MKLSRWISYGFAIALTAASLILVSMLRSPVAPIALQVLAGAIALGLIVLAVSSLYAKVYAARRKAEISLKKLQASEARYRRLLETAYEGIWVIDTNCTTEYVNPRMAEMLGYRVEEIIDSSIFKFMDEAAQRELQWEMKHHPTGIRGQYDLRFRHKDGSIVWTITSANPIFSDGGLFRGTLAMVTDVSDRKQLKETLHDREARISRLIDSNIIGIIFANFQGEITEANDAFLNMLGYTQADLQSGNLNWLDITPSEYLPQDEEMIEQISTTGACPPFEKEYLHKDGSRVPVLVGAALLPNPEEGTVCYVLDLSDRKRLENELSRREAKIKRLVDSNIIGVITANLNGSVLEANDAFLQIIGYTREDLNQGKIRWNEMTPPEYQQATEQSQHELRTLGFCHSFEKEYIRKDGSRVPIVIGSALLDGSPDTMIGFVLDVSDRKQAEAALRESEARFRYMADTAPVLIWMSGPDKLCNYFNQPWLDFTGRTLAQEIGNGWTESIHPDDFERCLHTYTTSFDARQEFKVEYRLRRFDSEYRWLLDIGVPRFTPDGEFLGYIGSCIDIGDRKQAEAEMQQINDLLEHRVRERTAQLETANQELEAFSYSVSHDLRAPLRHINGFVSLLQKQAAPVLDPESQRYLDIIADTTKRAGTMVDDLLTFSRMGRAEMRYTTVKFNELIRDVRQDLEPETAEREIIWQIHPIPNVQGDPAMLRQVIYNLVENAIKYTQGRTQAEIEIGTIGDEQEVVIFVRDNGLGFDMRYAHKLFGVFQRLHSEPEIQGTGIGLANVRRIIHRHGGRTWAESELDKGSTFYFSLPLRPRRGEE